MRAMRDMRILEEFQERSGAARLYRGIAVLLLVIALVFFALYGIDRAQFGVWSGAVLAGGIVLTAAALVLAALSLLRLRCPNCGRVIGEVFDPAFCPTCGAALKAGVDFEMEAPHPPEVPARRVRALVRRPEYARRPGLKTWEPRTGLAGINDYPEEAYPKNIRMFTTTNELELTKRYIQLIDRDNKRGLEPTPQTIGAENEYGARTSKNKPARRPADSDPDSRSIFERLLERIRNL
jgi:hypothetical protein